MLVIIDREYNCRRHMRYLKS